MASPYINASRVINHRNTGTDNATAESILRKQMSCTDNGTPFETSKHINECLKNIRLYQEQPNGWLSTI